MTTILRVEQLSKAFGQFEAVKNLSFSIEKGTCFGLLGPNGAGKTTSMEIIENIMTPTAGEIYYKGRLRTSSFSEEVGIQFQHTSLLNYLTVKETLSCFHKLFKNPLSLEELIKRCDLQPILHKNNNKLSGGQAQRLMFALALINQPELVFLDEPSTGLDPQARRNLWRIVETIKQEGKTIIMTTHSMEEAEYLCDEIAIMDQGTIIAQGSPALLISTYCKNETITLPVTAIGKTTLEELPFPCRTVGETVEIETDDINHSLDIFRKFKINLSQISVRSGNLEEVFLRLTGRKLRD